MDSVYSGAIQSESLDGSISESGSLDGELNGVGSLDGTLGSSAALAHPQLSGRSQPQQHPISAITDLTDELNERPSEVISDAFIELL